MTTYESVVVDRRDPEAASYRLAVPGTWMVVRELPRHLRRLAGDLRTLALFRGAEGPFVVLAAAPLASEVNLADWIRVQSVLLDFEVEGMAVPLRGSGQIARASGTMRDEWVCQLVAVASRGSVGVLLAGAQSNAAARVHARIGTVASSFSLRRPSSAEALEPMTRFVDREARFSVLVPGSWPVSLRDSLEPMKAVADFACPSDSDELSAFMRVAVDARFESDDDAGSLIALVEAELAGSQFVTTPLTAEPGLNLPPGCVHGRWDRHGRCGDVWVLVRRVRSYWCTATVLGPDKRHNLVAWMRAKRAFEWAVISLRDGAAPPSEEDEHHALRAGTA